MLSTETETSAETIEYTALEDGREARKTWVGERAKAVAAAAEHLDAIDLGDDSYAYHADETDRWYVVDADDLAVAGAAILAEAGDWYSLWCSSCGGLADSAQRAEIRAAGGDCDESYTLRDDSGTDYDLVATDLDEAIEEARESLQDGESGDDQTVTVWVHGAVHDADGEVVASLTVAIDPTEPDCADGHEHDWVSPRSDGQDDVHANGGGVVSTDACRHCGCERVTDSWAQDPQTGKQGLRSVRYTEHEYADTFRARGVEGADEADVMTDDESTEYTSDCGALYREAFAERMAERREEAAKETEE